MPARGDTKRQQNRYRLLYREIDLVIFYVLATVLREAKFFTERLGGLASMALNGPPDPRAGGPHRRG